MFEIRSITIKTHTDGKASHKEIKENPPKFDGAEVIEKYNRPSVHEKHDVRKPEYKILK